MRRRVIPSLDIIFIIAIVLVVGGASYYEMPHSGSTSTLPAFKSTEPSTANGTTSAAAPIRSLSVETTSIETASTSLNSYSSLGWPTETYVDPNDTFSLQYLRNFNVVPSEYYNGLGYHSRFCTSYVNCSRTIQLGELLIGIQPPGFESPNPSINTYLSYITVAYGTSTTEIACGQPGDSSTMVAKYRFNNILWSWGRFTYSGSQRPTQVDDQFQTYVSGACWGIEFDWNSSNDAPILPFEEAVMSTVRFLNNKAQPYYVPYNPEN